MAVSKRARFEILRRDNHTCQYCGEKAPDVTLHVDHVKPKTLGGTDAPENLVTACKDCNSGKASTILGSEHAQEIATRNIEWETQAQELSARIRGTLERDELYVSDFEREWQNVADVAGVPAVWPVGYKASIYKWAGMGYPLDALELAIGTAYSARRVENEDRFTYLAGIVWKQIREATVPLDEVEEPRIYTELDNIENYHLALHTARKQAVAQVHALHARWNPLSLIVDGITTPMINEMRWIRGSHSTDQA